MQRLSVTVNDATAAALRARAVEEGESPDPRSGKYQKTLRHAIRYYLLKNGSTAAQLDISDRSYHRAAQMAATAFPAGGNEDLDKAPAEGVQ
jgi:hypothetical protein